MDVIFTGHINLFTLKQRGKILEVTLKVLVNIWTAALRLVSCESLNSTKLFKSL